MSALTAPGRRLVVCTLLLAGSISAVAQDGDEDVDEIEEIQVTATRRPVEIRDISAALTVVTTEELARASFKRDEADQIIDMIRARLAVLAN